MPSGGFSEEFAFQFGDDPNSVAAAQAAAAAGLGPKMPMIDELTGDYVTVNGQMVFVFGTALIAQLLRERLRLFMGEYVQDTTEGMPYYQLILLKGASTSAIRGAFTQRILATPGVLNIQSLTLNVDPSSRVLNVTLSVQSSLGLLEDSFILPLTPQPAPSN